MWRGADAFSTAAESLVVASVIGSFPSSETPQECSKRDHESADCNRNPTHTIHVRS